jgi:molybdopterin/thiamine biosynthesis adenylyltransferase
MLVNTINPEEDDIVVFDGDCFEEKNLGRQLFGRDMLEENKATAMQRMYRRTANVRGVEDYVTCTEQLEGYDWVFCVPDNNKARRLAEQGAAEFGYHLIIGGNEATSANAMYWHPRMGDELRPTVIHKEMLLDSAPQNSCSATVHENPQSIVANNIAASMCMGLFTCWRCYGDGDFTRSFILQHLPLEFEWTKTSFKKYTGEEKLDMSNKGATDEE